METASAGLAGMVVAVDQECDAAPAGRGRLNSIRELTLLYKAQP